MIHTATSHTLYTDPKKRTPAAIGFNPGGHKLAVFIGKESSGLGGLMLESGYAGIAADHPDSSQNLLIRLLYGHGLLPDVILCDAGFPESEIRKLMAFVQSMTEFRYIPFLVYSGTDSTITKERIRRIMGVDDIIFSFTRIEDICTKVDFIKKFKSLKAKSPRPGMPQGIPGPKINANYIIKRVSDILISSVLLLVLSPLMLIIAILIRLESRGPVIYRSLRAGRAYQVFKFIKFRTMEVGADEKLKQLAHLNQYNGNADSKQPMFFKMSNDPRITRVGAILRNTSLDELPQLVNVLMGDMSLVGNRPLPLYEAATLTTDQWAERFLAPAGITGLWQIRKRGHKDMSVNERINLDIDYAKKHSFFYDMWIMAHTPSALIQNENV